MTSNTTASVPQGTTETTPKVGELKLDNSGMLWGYVKISQKNKIEVDADGKEFNIVVTKFGWCPLGKNVRTMEVHNIYDKPIGYINDFQLQDLMVWKGGLIYYAIPE